MKRLQGEFVLLVECDFPFAFSYLAVLAGRLKLLTPFWCATEVEHTDGHIQSSPLPEADGPFHYVNSCGLQYEAEEV